MKIFTLNGYFNYGNRLQLFALSKICTRMGKKVYVFWPKTFIQKVRNLVSYLAKSGNERCKRRKLKKFTKEKIAKRSNNPKCDYSVVGSDQVWNPEYYQNDNYLLDVPNNSKKIAYAASIGRDYLEDKELEDFKNALKTYSAISVREQSAKKILQPLTDKKIEVVLDPTLLLDKEEYEKIEAKPKDIEGKDKYILCYILGGREQISKIEEYASKHNYKIIMFSDKKDSSYGVEEFLYLIHHAQIVCTDSFHACVFSFIFERPFIAFKRTGEANYMYTRLKNLIDTFNLKNREFNGIEITDENVNVDYSEAKKILKIEQEKSMDFLKKALEVDNEK